MSDVFISYSKKDREVAEALADDLKDRDIDVWWDFELYAGEDFHDVIMEQLERAKAVIVIWSENSVQSKWVRGEADEALEHGKLIATHVTSFERGKVPLNFRGVHREDVEDRDRILRALQRKGVAVNPVGTSLPGIGDSPDLAGIPHEERDGLPEEPVGTSPESDEVIWYIGRDGQQHGPLSDSEMQLFHNAGHLRVTDLVWNPELPDWVPAAQLFNNCQEEHLSSAASDAGGRSAINDAGISGYDADAGYTDGPNRRAPVASRRAGSVRDPDDPETWGKVARNETCPCGSGKKYKHCHGRLS